MGRCASPIQLQGILQRPVLDFLCPALTRSTRSEWSRRPPILNRQGPVSKIHTEHSPDYVTQSSSLLLDLPRSCPGCGAFTQNISTDAAGYYNPQRKSVQAFFGRATQKSVSPEFKEAVLLKDVLAAADPSLRSQLGINGGLLQESTPKPYDEHQSPVLGGEPASLPVCDRCHRLLHHHSYEPATHITVGSIQDILQESPYKHNHIYHVLDAADFPLSLIPTLQRSLSLSPQRSRNRRASTAHYQGGRRADISYVITRSDLLAPTKQKLDGLMPCLVQVLRDAIGGHAEHVRLGNVYCVSSHRGWWTKSVKEKIWKRGGANWMVGKANVGKSSLLENIFPKGHAGDMNVGRLTKGPTEAASLEDEYKALQRGVLSRGEKARAEQDDESFPLSDSLLPPLPKEQKYPTLPIVSALPGTTAAPIRNSFGNGKGELIDLPGLNRGDLSSFVTEEHRGQLVMDHRIKPSQLTIKPGQSLLIGGLITITPKEPEIDFLAYSFLPLPVHVTSTKKASMMTAQESFPQGTSIARPGISRRTLNAGTFPLRWDVTKSRAGPLTRKDAVGLKAKVLPFVVFSADVLVEGCGWIELVAQVRRRHLEVEKETNASGQNPLFDSTPYPSVEISSPDGKYIGVRRPMGAALLGADRPGAKAASRPRPSMRGMKRHLKKVARMETSEKS